MAVNVFACQGCCTDVCLRHRFPTDHDCSLRAAAKGISQPKRSARFGKPSFKGSPLLKCVAVPRMHMSRFT